jgi:hypothetical protein
MIVIPIGRQDLVAQIIRQDKDDVRRLLGLEGMNPQEHEKPKTSN